MENSQATTLNCTQCGGELHPEEGSIFVTCQYCKATVYLDKSRVVFHWYLAPTLNENQAAAALARWMSGSQTVKDLDKKSQVISSSFQYFPLWYFKWGAEKQEKVDLQLAAASSVTELRNLTLPAGDLARFDPNLEKQAVEPTVPLEAALEWLRQSHANLEVRESALVHVPIYVFKYVYKGQTFTAVVEAGTGSVLANIFPAKAEAPYLLAAGLTAVVYLCLATFPLIGGEVTVGGQVSGAVLALVIGAIAAPFLFALAVWVASKV